jgi:hypothetical protein
MTMLGDAAIGLRLLGHEIVGDRKIRGERAAFEKELLALVGTEIGQVAGQWQRFGVRGRRKKIGREQAEREREVLKKAAWHH